MGLLFEVPVPKLRKRGFFLQSGHTTFYHGNVLEVLKAMPANSVQCVVTSPPYFGLRSYDENAVCIDPKLPPEKRAWLEKELKRRGIYART